MENSGKIPKRKSYKDRRTGNYIEQVLYPKALKDKAVELAKNVDNETYRWADLLIQLKELFPDNPSLRDEKLTAKTVKAWVKKNDISTGDTKKAPKKVKKQIIWQDAEPHTPKPRATELQLVKPITVTQEVEPQIVTQEVEPRVVSKELKQHKEELALCAKELVKRLKNYVEEEWAGDLEISAILVNQNDFDAIEFFNKDITQELFVHLTSLDNEFAELKGLGSWEDLLVGQITEPFLNLISLKAARRDFEGRCSSCPK